MLITLNHLKSSLQAVKTYINNVLPKKVSDLVDDSGHYTKPSGGIPASDLADGVIPVEDVQVNGTSIVADGVANIPVMSSTSPGVAMIGNGLAINSLKQLYVSNANNDTIKIGTNTSQPIIPGRQHIATFYGLTKAAGVDMKDSSNPVGTYTDEAKTAINKMIGSYNLNSGEAIPTNADLNTYTTPGTYNADSTVIASITNAPTTTDTYKLVVETVSETAIEQIVTAANGKVYRRTGDSSSSTWVFTNWAKDITNTDYATDTEAGVVKIYGPNGISIHSNKQLAINYPSSTQIKNGAAYFRPIVPALQHESVFYGLAKAAGDTTQSVSSNAVGTYTDEAKIAIKSMLDITTPETVGSCVEYITDSSVTIVGEPNTRYVCGEVTSIDITPPAVGTIDVVFTSGSTIAILTLPSTVKMPEWWGGVEAGYTYELVITDGVYAGVMAWPQ